MGWMRWEGKLLYLYMPLLRREERREMREAQQRPGEHFRRFLFARTCYVR